MVPYGAVATTTPVAGSDLTILVDRRGATLHPMGRVLRPHLQSTEVAGALREVMTVPAGVTTILAAPAPSGFGRRRQEPARPHSRPARSTCASDHDPPTRWAVRGPPPNRARRAVELVAYLALHRPDGITGDRLRTGSSARPTPMPPPRRSSTPRRGTPCHGCRRARRAALPRRQPHGGLSGLAPRDGGRGTAPSPWRARDGRRPTPRWRSPTSGPHSISWRASRSPTRCRGIRGGTPRGTEGASPRYSSTPRAPWRSWRPVPVSSNWRAGVWSGRVWWSPTARRSPRRHAACGDRG